MQVEHTQGELSVDRDRRETLYKNIGSLELVVLQNASRFTPSPDPNTLRSPRRYTRVVSYARGKVSLSAVARCVPARCSQSRWGSCCV